MCEKEQSTQYLETKPQLKWSLWSTAQQQASLSSPQATLISLLLLLILITSQVEFGEFNGE